MITSYSASLLEAGKFKHMAYSMTSLIGALKGNPRLAPVCREEPYTFRFHQLKLSGSIYCRGISAKKSTSTYHFNARLGLN